MTTHHRRPTTGAGEIVHRQSERRMMPGIDERRAIEDYIVVRDAEGRELRKLAMSDALRNADWLALRKACWRRVEERGYGLKKRGLYDPFHTNSIWLLTEVDAERLGDPLGDITLDCKDVIKLTVVRLCPQVLLRLRVLELRCHAYPSSGPAYPPLHHRADPAGTR